MSDENTQSWRDRFGSDAPWTTLQCPIGNGSTLYRAYFRPHGWKTDGPRPHRLWLGVRANSRDEALTTFRALHRFAHMNADILAVGPDGPDMSLEVALKEGFGV